LAQAAYGKLELATRKRDRQQPHERNQDHKFKMEAIEKLSEEAPLLSSSNIQHTYSHSSSYAGTNRETLRKSIGCIQLFSYVICVMLGAGVYICPGLVAKNSSNMGEALILWILAGIVSLLGSLCFCELAISLKKTGSFYIYIKEAYGDKAGFLAMWTLVIVLNPAALAVVSVAIGEHVVGTFTDISSPNGIWMIKGVAVLCLLLSSSINLVSTSFINKTQEFFSSLQIIAIVFFICVGVWKVSTGEIKHYSSIFAANRSMDVKSFGVAFYSALWAYDGWGSLPSVTEELTNIQRDLWLAIVTGVPIVIMCYVLMNLAYISVLSFPEIANSPIVASNFIKKSLGTKVVLMVPIIVTVTCFGTLNAGNLLLSRCMLSAAREGHLPEPLCYIHKQRRTPVIALFASFLLSSIWVLSLGSDTGILITYFSFAAWIVYGLAISATIKLRITQPNLPRPFKVWIINPIFMCFVSAYLVAAPFFQHPIECTICLAILLLAIPAYLIAVSNLKCFPSSFKRFKENVYACILRRLNLAVCVYIEDQE